MPTASGSPLPVRQHLPHLPPPSVQQYAAGAVYFITICADRQHYGIVMGGGGVRTRRPTDTPHGSEPNVSPHDMVGRVVLNAPMANAPQIGPLTHGNTAIRLLISLDFCRQRRLFFPYMAVVMPDHLHLLASFPESTTMSNAIQNWKRWTAKNLGIVWQSGFFDFRPRTDAQLADKMRYMAENPVRKGLCNDAEDWPFRMSW